VLAALVLVAACGAPPRPAPPTPPPAAPAPPSADRPGARSVAPRPVPTPPTFRLPAIAKPMAYVAELTVDPAQPTFAGKIDVDVELSSATDVLWLNGQDLVVTAASIEGVGAVEPVYAPPRFVGLRAPAPLGPGPLHVEVSYTGKVVRGDSLGFFAQQIGGAWYGFTQFEPLGARQVFPCFDEPQWKTPWRLTLHVPPGLVAVSNAPGDAPARDEAGLQVFRFARTPALPSYLVAFAIGPFEAIDAGRSQGGTPVRILAPRGRTREAAYAASVTAPLLSRLEDYFGSAHPFDKLDVVPVPEAFGFSAMENPGLITYVESLVLHRPEELTLADRRAYAETAVHEMAHQWFGNLVTSAWWDDIWLNEALATWVESKIVDGWKPEWGVRVHDVATAARALHADDLDSARRVREPVHDENDIENAFDGITYYKGATVLRMVELWVGEAAFQKGIRAYLAQHARGVASYADFVGEVGKVVERDLAGPLGSFLDQNGVPVVSVERHCEPGQPPRFALAQKRYLPLGASGDRDRLWQVPVCLGWTEGARPQTACTLLTGSTGELVLDAGRACPQALRANAEGAGYYHGRVEDAVLTEVLERKAFARLSATQRLALHNDLEALVGSGDVDLARLLELAVRLAGDPNRFVREAALADFEALDDLVPDAARGAYQRAIRQLFGAAAKKLGLTSRRGEPEDTALLRPTLVALVADQGDDAALLAEARRLTERWLGDRRAIGAELVDTVLHLAATRGDRALHDRLLAALRGAKELQDRRRLLDALGAFRDPQLVSEQLALVLGDELALTETIDLLDDAAAWRGTREVAWSFLVAHFDELAKRLPKERVGDLIELGLGACSQAKRDETAAFFATRKNDVLGGPRDLAQVLDRFDLCVAYRARHTPSLVKFLERYR
jgi:alanyl aminopeptidase